MKKKKTFKQSVSKREKILKVATKLFGKKGFKGATVREIARNAEVNESMINHYFESKVQLFKECTQTLDSSRLELLRRLLVAPESKDEFRFRLQVATQELVDYHMHNIDSVRVFYAQMMFEQDMPDPSTQKKWIEFNSVLVNFFKESKEKGYLKESVDPKVIASTLYLTFSHLIQMDSYANEQFGFEIHESDQRLKLVKQVVDLLLDGAITN